MQQSRILILCSLFLTGRAAAETPRERADERFEAGRKLMEAGKIAEACTAFEDSQQLDPAVTTLLNLAACRERAGQLASATAVFRAAARAADEDRTPAGKQLAQIASGHVRRLEPRVSTLTIVVPRDKRAPGLTIEREGTRVDELQWNVPQPVDGGRYKIVAHAPRRAEWSTTIEIAPEKDSKSVSIPLLGVDVSEPPPTETTASSGRSLVWPVTFGVAGLASGGAAFYFSRRGDEIYDQAKSESDPAARDRLWQQANQRRYLAQGLAVTGVVCIGVAVWLLVRGGPSKQPASSARIDLQPSHNGGMAVLVGSY